jgi:hypothetical protein
LVEHVGDPQAAGVRGEDLGLGGSHRGLHLVLVRFDPGQRIAAGQ